jgi:D-alanyl-lipoteichoic acid acyltransferase DltB (MBOAT superfamily)
MSILSVDCAAFVLAVALALAWAPRQARSWILGVASLTFYALSDRSHLWVLAALIVLVYGLAQALETTTGRVRATLLAVGVISVLGTLGAYKYLNFVVGSFLAVFGSSVPTDAWSSGTVVPLGLSFYSLRLVAYLLDVHRKTIPAERHIGRFCAFIALFLEIGSGPIERAKSLLPQLDETPTFDYTRVTSGLIRIAWGVFKKTAVADYLALTVGVVYGHPAKYSGPVLLLATVAFALQLYLDFSGYTDVAIGAGQVVGLKLAENFVQPYFAGSVGEFWHRWHISLSNWLRDYVFLPVAYASDRKLAATRLRPRVANLTCFGVASMATMLVAGLWHGAGWTFVIWGGLNGAFMTVGRMTAPWRTSMWRTVGLASGTAVRRLVSVSTTFVSLCFAWVFFRSASLADAVGILRGIATWRQAPASPGWLPGVIASLGMGPRRFLVTAAFVVAVLVVDLWCEVSRADPVALVRRQRVIVRWACYYAVLFAIWQFGNSGEKAFVYFQF